MGFDFIPPAGRGFLFKRALLILVAVCLPAAACGSGSTATGTADLVAPPGAADSNIRVASTRPGGGIMAAGGNVTEVVADCSDPLAGSPHGTVRIGWVGPDVRELEDIGIEGLIFDDPVRIVRAYINQLNEAGGLNGFCFELLEYHWGLLSNTEDHAEACDALSLREPVVVLALALAAQTYQCATLEAGIPTLGLSTYTFSAPSFALAGGRLFVREGSGEHILSAALRTAATTGVISGLDRLGVLHEENENTILENLTADSESRSLGLRVVASLTVPGRFADPGLLAAEQHVRLLQPGLSEQETESALRAMDALPPDLRAGLSAMETFFIDAAADFRDRGVTTVVAAGGYADVRRLMRAAEQIGWRPRWLITDEQPAFLVLTDTPKAQSVNLTQISSGRAPEDGIPVLDRGCLNLRNSAPGYERFAYRFHTDAWNLLTGTCDLLDVVFAAISRVGGNLTRQSFVESMSQTEYVTPHGSLIRYDADDRYGADLLRVLEADPDCALSEWGCMRAVSKWKSPSLGL